MVISVNEKVTKNRNFSVKVLQFLRFSEKVKTGFEKIGDMASVKFSALQHPQIRIIVSRKTKKLLREIWSQLLYYSNLQQKRDFYRENCLFRLCWSYCSRQLVWYWVMCVCLLLHTECIHPTLPLFAVASCELPDRNAEIFAKYYS